MVSVELAGISEGVITFWGKIPTLVSYRPAWRLSGRPPSLVNAYLTPAFNGLALSTVRDPPHPADVAVDRSLVFAEATLLRMLERNWGPWRRDFPYRAAPRAPVALQHPQEGRLRED